METTTINRCVYTYNLGDRSNRRGKILPRVYLCDGLVDKTWSLALTSPRRRVAFSCRGPGPDRKQKEEVYQRSGGGGRRRKELPSLWQRRREQNPRIVGNCEQYNNEGT